MISHFPFVLIFVNISKIVLQLQFDHQTYFPLDANQSQKFPLICMLVHRLNRVDEEYILFDAESTFPPDDE